MSLDCGFCGLGIGTDKEGMCSLLGLAHVSHSNKVARACGPRGLVCCVLCDVRAFNKDLMAMTKLRVPFSFVSVCACVC